MSSFRIPNPDNVTWSCTMCEHENPLSLVPGHCQSCRTVIHPRYLDVIKWQCHCGRENNLFDEKCGGCQLDRTRSDDLVKVVKKGALVRCASGQCIVTSAELSTHVCIQAGPSFEEEIKALESKAEGESLKRPREEAADSDNQIKKKMTTELATGPTPAAEEQKTILIAVDIERWGPDYKFGVGAVGACAGFNDGTIISKVAFCDKVPPPAGFDKKCWDEFWVNCPDQLARMQAKAMPFHMQCFYAWIMGLHKQFGPFGRRVKNARYKLRWVSDNPAYDIGFINMAFRDLGIERPLSEMFEDYVPTDDPTERQEGLTPKQSALVETFITAVHDHFPSNDADQIYQRACAFKVVKDATTVELNENGDEVVKIDMVKIDAARQVCARSLKE